MSTSRGHPCSRLKKGAIRILDRDQHHDVTMALDLLSAVGSIERLVDDKAYDTNRLRYLFAQLRDEAVMASILGTACRCVSSNCCC
jgi:hypothetical protein